MTATYDSPEAFEEILWLAFWPAKYREDLILLWTAEDDNPEFESFFRKHIRKLVALRTEARGDGSGSRRYVSKNNANIARIPFLRRTFPDSVIVVPFRNPIDHVGSMLRQQHNFTAIHRADAFAREYMEAIGHFEFGASRRAIEFRTTAGTLGDSQTATYWLTYWIEAFSFLIGLDPLSFRLFDYDKACARPRASLMVWRAQSNSNPQAPVLQRPMRFTIPFATIPGISRLIRRFLPEPWLFTRSLLSVP